MEQWRLNISKKLLPKELKDFYLLGHSFGGYIASNYALKYYQNLKKLILLSPIGIKNTDAAIEDGKSIIDIDYVEKSPQIN